MKLVFLLVLLVFLKVAALHRVYHRLPLAELKRRARSHDRQAAALYKVASYQKTLDTALYVFGIVSASILLIMSARYAWWLAVVIICLMAWLFLWAPPTRIGGPLWRLCAWNAPYIFKFISLAHPVFDALGRLLPAGGRAHVHTGAYELDDLLEILNRQNHQVDNRIPEEDLKIAFNALSFGNKLVSAVMTPRRSVRFVSEDDVAGPLLMDELHKTGFSRFPVVRGPAKAAAPQVVGTLYLKDLIDIGQENKGKVKDLMKRGASFINEACDLRQALDAVIKNHHLQLVVVNNFEEMTGVLTLEDILEQVIGRPIIDEFDKYDDLRAVAGLDAKRERAHHGEVKTAEVAPAEVVSVSD